MADLKWEKYGKVHVALEGDRIIGCVGQIGASEGAPCEMYQVQFMDNAFATLEAAQAELLADYQQIASRVEPVSFREQMVDILKHAVDALDKSKVKEVA
jgi:hypothetical protein